MEPGERFLSAKCEEWFIIGGHQLWKFSYGSRGWWERAGEILIVIQTPFKYVLVGENCGNGLEKNGSNVKMFKIYEFDNLAILIRQNFDSDSMNTTAVVEPIIKM